MAVAMANEIASAAKCRNFGGYRAREATFRVEAGIVKAARDGEDAWASFGGA
jgi:hypothetical protein